MNLKTILIAFIFVFGGINLSSAQGNFNLDFASNLIDQGKYMEAIPFVESHLEENPNDEMGHVLRAFIYVGNDSLYSAIRSVNNAIYLVKKASNSSVSQLVYLIKYRASLYLDVKMYAESLFDYSLLVAAMPKDSVEHINEFLFERANVYYHYGKLSKAEADYKLILSTRPESVSALAGVMRNMIAKGKYEDAIELSEKALALDSLYPETYKFRAQAYKAHGEHRKAIDAVYTYGRLVEWKFNARSMADMMEGDFDYATSRIEPILEDNFGDANVLLIALEIYDRTDEHAKELRVINMLEKILGEKFAIYYQRSFTHMDLGDTLSALADINASFAVAEDRSDTISAYGQRTNIYMANARYDEAIADFNTIIGYGDASAYAYYRRAWCYESMEDYDKALEDLDRAVKIDPKDASLFERRGSIYLKTGEEALAKRDFKQVLRLDKKVHINSARPYALFYLGKYDDAIKWQQKVIAANIDSYVGYYNLACLYAKMKKSAEALEALEEAFKRNYNSFVHIENDEDMDNIRDLAEFKALIEKYKNISEAE